MIKKIYIFIFLCLGIISFSNEMKAQTVYKLWHELETFLGDYSHGELYKDDMVLNISDQNTFANIPTYLSESVNAGNRNIRIRIRQGIYYYDDKFLNIKKDWRNINLTIEGENAILIGKVKKNNENDLDYNDYFFDASKKRNVDFWSGIIQADSLVSVVDRSKKICCLKVKDTNNAEVGDYIQISRQWHSVVCKIVNVENHRIFFKYDKLEYLSEKKEYNINRDFLFAKKFPRYRIWHFSKKYKDVNRSKVSCFAYLKDCSIGILRFSGLQFLGSANSKCALIELNNVKNTGILIDACLFSDCKSTCISSRMTNNIKCENCSFLNACNCIRIHNGSSNITLKGNKFFNNNSSWTNSTCVYLSGDNFYVAKNLFQNFEYSAICIGVNYIHPRAYPVTGIVEDNEMYYTPDYLKDSERNNFMDSGCIYTCTQCDDVIIRYNYIHDYSGLCCNRGIFCDDGGKNLSIYGNVILNIKNSFAIDSREVKRIESESKSRVSIANVNNKVFFNIVDSNIRFGGRNHGDNGCLYGKNVFFQVSPDDNVITHTKIISDDVYLKSFQIVNDKIKLGKGDLGILKSFPFYRRIKYIFE